MNSYRELLVQHIAKENEALFPIFPMACQLISEGKSVEKVEEMESRFDSEALLKELEELVKIVKS